MRCRARTIVELMDWPPPLIAGRGVHQRGRHCFATKPPLMGEQSRAMHVTEGETQSITSTSAISRHRPSPARHGSSQTILNIRVGPCLSPGLHFLPPRAALAPTGAFAVRRFSSFHHSGHSFMQLQQHPHHSLRHQRGKTAIKPKSHPAEQPKRDSTAIQSQKHPTEHVSAT